MPLHKVQTNKVTVIFHRIHSHAENNQVMT